MLNHSKMKIKKSLLLYKNSLYKLIKYGIVGLIGAIVHIILTIFFVEIMDLSPIIGSFLGFIIVLAISFFLNKSWTFRVKGKNTIYFFKYLIVSLTGLVINLIILYSTVNLFNWSYFYGMGISTIFVAISNFVMNQLWTFGEKNKEGG
uniref:GtrA family protein n=1 Tax=Paenibacillus sp. FSL W7-1332 TaxID=2921702 RepID=UPI00403F3D3B